MTSFELKDLLNTSEGVKNSVEIYNRLDNTANVAGQDILMSQYLDLAVRAVQNLNKNIKDPLELRGVNVALDTRENITPGNFYKNDYLDMAKRIQEHAEANARIPGYGLCGLGNIPWQTLVYVYARILTWYKNNNYLPNYATIKKWTGSPPIKVQGQEVRLNVPHDRQDDKCRCCPSTLFMIFNYYGVPVTEQQLATAMETSDTTTSGSGCSGTGPSQIKVAVDYVNTKFGRNFKYENKYLSDVGGIQGLKEYIKKGIPVCLHVIEKGFSWANSQVGHYVPYVGFKTGYSRINDPYWVEGSEKWEADQCVVDAINLKTGVKSLHIIWE